MCSPIRCRHEVKQKRFFCSFFGGGGGGLFHVKFANRRIRNWFQCQFWIEHACIELDSLAV